MSAIANTNIVSFNGILTFNVIEPVLEDTKNKLQHNHVESIIQKRLYAILVESLENALKHQASVPTKNMNYNEVKMSLKLYDNLFVLSIGNFTQNKRIQVLTDRIDEINRLDLEALNNLYRTSIANARISDKGGAGLGIIEIARSSRHQIKYNFVKEDHDISFFTIEIHLSKNILTK